MQEAYLHTDSDSDGNSHAMRHGNRLARRKPHRLSHADGDGDGIGHTHVNTDSHIFPTAGGGSGR